MELVKTQGTPSHLFLSLRSISKPKPVPLELFIICHCQRVTHAIDFARLHFAVLKSLKESLMFVNVCLVMNIENANVELLSVTWHETSYWRGRDVTLPQTYHPYN
jgi:hypothetical protein